MRISKILNNNVAVIVDDKVERIVMGRGICFQKQCGDLINEQKIDKTFTLSNPDTMKKFQELILDIPPQYLTLCEDIITYAKDKLQKKLNDSIIISLTDHIYTSVLRFQEGIIVRNAMLWDIQRFYKDEYLIGLEALKRIWDTFHIQLPEDEAGFIALHFVNAEMESGQLQDIYQMAKIMQEICNIVKYELHIDFDKESVYYYRFITHLKYFSQRMIDGKGYQDETDSEIFEVVKKKYQNAYGCVEKIAQYIYKHYHYILSNEEKMYLTIHIQRVVYKAGKE